MYLESAQGRSPVQQRKIAELLRIFSNTFSNNDTDLGLTHLVEHSIETGGAKPIKQSPRRVPMAFTQAEKNLIDQMMQQGVIKASCSPW